MGVSNSQPHHTQNWIELHQQSMDLREKALRMEQRFLSRQHTDELHPSARNLLHYLSVRQQDIRTLQWQLLHCGFTSLSDIGAYTLARINSVITLLEKLLGEVNYVPEAPVDDISGPRWLRENSLTLLGAGIEQTQVRIMVTMPSQAAEDGKLIADLLQAGMTVMRINCAHDDANAWQTMVNHLHLAQKAQGKYCKIQADLAGPKLRTGKISASGQVIKLKPSRDLYGHVLQPCKVLLCSHTDLPLPKSNNAQLVLKQSFLRQCKQGDRIEFADSRGQKRAQTIVSASQADGYMAELFRTAYLSPQTIFKLVRKGKHVASAVPENIPQVTLPIPLKAGDSLVLTRDSAPGRHARTDHLGKCVTLPARIHCTLPQAFDQVEPGHSVWFDDGKLGGVVETNNGEEMLVRITQAAPQGNKLHEAKGINFPDTPLDIAALTEKDIGDLEQAVQWADIVALSFVRCADDVQLLHEKLMALDKPNTGVVLKIENRQAFINLPSILLKAISIQRPLGVMVARGDLAVEVGFERLSEVQQEILWLCEAAHVPVIWATQILESMAKRGLPSRAEVSDAGMGVFAECAMLNKGPYILDTVRLLKGILSRMDGHYQKRRATLRKLSVAEFDPPV